MNFDLTEFALKEGVRHWLWVFGSVCIALLVASAVFSYIFSGTDGAKSLGRLLANGVKDILSISFKRVLAISSLTIKEVIRKKTLMVFVVFAILFMFGGWFLTGQSDIREDLLIRNYISFALTTISWLILPVAILMACWGVPEDIKAKSIHTIVTKPARRLEIVVGRILGYVSVGTVVLVLMGIVGNIWIHRQVTQEGQQYLISRVPLYGKMAFLDREGKPTSEGIHVGDIWDYRRYIEGATLSAALWEYDDVTPELLINDSLKLEARFESFRTHKGDMKRGLLCQVFLVNPVTKRKVNLPVFQVNEFTNNMIVINRKINHYDEAEKKYLELDLFDDLVFDIEETKKEEKNLRIGVRCIDPGQYIGMAQPDMFIRYPDRSFDVGYSKAVFGIWLMMVMIISLGVAASCFLKGPVATLLTFSFFLVGQGGFRQFLDEYVDKQVLGGGPVESIIRIVTHLNQIKELEEGTTKQVAEIIDKGFFYFLEVAQQIIPDFTTFKMTPFVVNGFDVAWGSAILPSIAITLAYVIPCILIGYFSLNSRELESK